MIIAGLFGAVFGSFATALIYRMPRDINWVSQRSACTKCGHNLNVLDLFPVLSYLISRGKCRYCKTQFGYNYLIVELTMILAFIGIAYIFGDSVKTLILCLLTFATIVITAVDFEHYIIPDEMNILIFILGIAYAISNNEGIEQMLYMPLFYFGLAMALRYLMFFWKKKEGLGLGDVKFFLAAGTFLNIEGLPAFLFISGAVGIIIAILWKILKKGELFPFGPALAISLLFCVAFPESNQYMVMFIQDFIH